MNGYDVYVDGKRVLHNQPAGDSSDPTRFARETLYSHASQQNLNLNESKVEFRVVQMQVSVLHG